MPSYRMKVAKFVLAGALAAGAAGGLAACGSSTKNQPAKPASNVDHPASTSPNTTAPSGGGVSY